MSVLSGVPRRISHILQGKAGEHLIVLSVWMYLMMMMIESGGGGRGGSQRVSMIIFIAFLSLSAIELRKACFFFCLTSLDVFRTSCHTKF